MPDDREDLDPPPLYDKCDPLSRTFPPGWRVTRFRRNSVVREGQRKYQCPLCQGWFDHTEFDFLEGDHTWPYSLFGESSWANYDLICGTCNARKSNFIDTTIRLVLGAGEFRKIVCDYLRAKIAQEVIARSNFLDRMLVE
jgi:hypothetical protein